MAPRPKKSKTPKPDLNDEFGLSSSGDESIEVFPKKSKNFFDNISLSDDDELSVANNVTGTVSRKVVTNDSFSSDSEELLKADDSDSELLEDVVKSTKTAACNLRFDQLDLEELDRRWEKACQDDAVSSARQQNGSSVEQVGPRVEHFDGEADTTVNMEPDHDYSKPTTSKGNS